MGGEGVSEKRVTWFAGVASPLLIVLSAFSLSSCKEIPLTLHGGAKEPSNPVSAPGAWATPVPTPSRPLVVLTRESPSTFFEGPDGKAQGFEMELVSRFAAHIGRSVEFRVAPNTKSLIERLRSGEADFAAAGLSVSHGGAEEFVFGPVYYETPIFLACRLFFTLSSLSDLRKDLVVSEGSVFEELLKDIYKGAVAYRVSPKSIEELLDDVAEGDADCTMTGAHMLGLRGAQQQALPVVHEWPEKDRLAWVFPVRKTYLRDASEGWFEKLQVSGELRSIADRYFGHSGEFDSYDVGRFMQRIRTRLPQFEPIFRNAAALTGLDWDLIAAVSYQESHWNPRAKSPTGVRGMMMLTLETAETLGISNRLDPEQSITGGARYLRRILRQMPRFLRPEDRQWLALAAYNIGTGHLHDARALAIWKGKNPNTWHDVQDVLPLLANPAYGPMLRHGPARGYEAVDFVRRIRNYLKILRSHQEKTETVALETEQKSKGEAPVPVLENKAPAAVQGIPAVPQDDSVPTGEPLVTRDASAPAD